MRRIADDLFRQVGKRHEKIGWEVKHEIEFMIENTLAHRDT